MFIRSIVVASLACAISLAGESSQGAEKVRMLLQVRSGGRPNYGPNRKLSLPLEAVRASGGTLIGQTSKGYLIIELSETALPQARKALRRLPGVRIVPTSEKPGKLHRANRLILKYDKNRRLSTGKLRRLGLTSVRDHPLTSLLVVSGDKGISARTLEQLDADPDVVYVEHDQIIQIDKPGAKPSE